MPRTTHSQLGSICFCKIVRLILNYFHNKHQFLTLMIMFIYSSIIEIFFRWIKVLQLYLSVALINSFTSLKHLMIAIHHTNNYPKGTLVIVTIKYGPNSRDISHCHHHIRPTKILNLLSRRQ